MKDNNVSINGVQTFLHSQVPYHKGKKERKKENDNKIVDYVA
ncbi:hypothetical protein [Pseudolactococcus raffinolactis]|nr:hypothetical protein [Lactococcus raffinolactis]